MDVKGRESISSTGSFVAIPSAYPTAGAEISRALKFEFTFSRLASGRLQPEFSTNIALIDFGAVNARVIDARKIIADCDLLKKIASTYPEELKEMLTELQKGTSEAVERGLSVAKRIGLTEEAAISDGGGFLITLIVIGGGLLLAGCGGALKEKPTSPAATTTPKQPRDGGTDGGQ